MTVLLRRNTYWHCAFCNVTDATTENRPHSRMHTCPGRFGMTMPLIEDGTKAKVEIREREDYIGSEMVQLFNGRPVMSVVTTRDDGQDAIVFAPTATGKGS